MISEIFWVKTEAHVNKWAIHKSKLQSSRLLRNGNRALRSVVPSKCGHHLREPMTSNVSNRLSFRIRCRIGPCSQTAYAQISSAMYFSVIRLQVKQLQPAHPLYTTLCASSAKELSWPIIIQSNFCSWNCKGPRKCNGIDLTHGLSELVLRNTI